MASGFARRFTAPMDWFPPLLARLSLGLLFLISGWGKIHGLSRVVDYFTQLGIPDPQIAAPLVAWVEVVCGILLILGLAARLAALPLIINMIVAISVAKASDIHDIHDLFMTPEFLFIVLLSWIAIAGPGSVALDRWVWSSFEDLASDRAIDDATIRDLRKTG